MELWIRSQDKEKLIKDENLFVEYNGDVDPELCPYSIVTDKCVKLGIYKNYERALEVLDEIHNILHPVVFMSAEIDTNDNSWVENGIVYQKYNDNFDIQHLSTYVYQMPEE